MITNIPLIFNIYHLYIIVIRMYLSILLYTITDFLVLSVIFILIISYQLLQLFISFTMWANKGQQWPSFTLSYASSIYEYFVLVTNVIFNHLLLRS